MLKIKSIFLLKRFNYYTLVQDYLEMMRICSITN